MPNLSLQFVGSQQRVPGLMQALASALALRLGLPRVRVRVRRNRHREREPVPGEPVPDRSLKFVSSQQRLPGLMQALAST